MKLTCVIVAVVAVIAAGIIAFVAPAWRSEIEPVQPASADSFNPALVERGAQLATIGNCNTCHTADGGEVFAGGFAVPTPFGTVYSTNITPDPETGIGRWPEPAFQRAMREGVDREGNHLYLAFPYDHFTLVNEEDNRAIYAFLMTRTPVNAVAPANDLVFPLNMRMLVAGWKLLYLDQGAYQPDLRTTGKGRARMDRIAARSTAIANALADATGVRMRELPLTRKRVQPRFGV